MRDADATRSRILDAATAEFARHGIAGSRVDRIAASARANKAQIYAYFGGKDALFDVVYDHQLRSIVEAVPLDPLDLPGYAVRLYDAWLDDPDRVRIATWARLERTPTGHLLDEPQRAVAYGEDAIRRAQDAGDLPDDLAPLDLQALVVSMSLAWAPASLIYVAGADDPHRDARREALRDAVRRMLGREA
ncbi:TetR family transcriptional regulator [Nocardioides plantarum]|uniref:TetR family transcriptional regulator n=1 Tax=Nocardioides plantarum TaxID=29299 RepID=A0ABV5KG67_9ACTN|nr:TetR family transcriptional regulator [Nocardioides plantarum]